MNILTRPLCTALSAGFLLFLAAEAQAQSTWTGLVSSQYASPGNWSPAAVPTAADNVIIPAGTPNQPTVTAVGRALNLTINAGATLTVTNPGVLTVGGNVTDNGTYTSTGVLNVGGNIIDNGVFGGGVVQAAGTSAQTISGTGTGISGQPIDLVDLMVMNAAGVTLNHSMTIARQLALSGNLTTNPISTVNTLTLLSTPLTTAFVVNNDPYIVNGPVTVQRAIDGSINTGLGYRHYSSPVAASTIADLATTGFVPEISAGVAYNTSVNPRATVPFPTVYDYDQVRVANGAINYPGSIDRGFEVPNPALGLNAPLEVGRGYAVNIASNALVDFVGTLNNGVYTRSLARNAAATTDSNLAGWHLVGNPYPAPLDFSVLAPPPGTATPDLIGVDAAIYVVQSTSQYGNTYRTYTSATNLINPIAPVGQGFFVHVSTPGTTGSITFRNSQRLTSSDFTTFQRPTAITHPQVELTLRSTATPALEDLAVVFFENGSTNGVDSRYDAIKLPNSTGLNVSSLTASGESLAIDGRPQPTGQVTVPLQVFVPVTGTYTLQASALRNMNGMYSYLRDIQTGTFTDLSQQSTYTFSLNATNFTPRFELVFSSRPLAAAPSALTQQVALYPSPAKGVAFIELPASLGSQALTATLVDAVGRVVRTKTLPAQGTAAHQLSLEGLAAGVYAVQLRTNAGLVVKRLVIE